MDYELFNELLDSDDITDYIYSVCALLNDIDSIEGICNYSFSSEPDNSIKVDKIVLFALIDRIEWFLKTIDDVDYKLEVSSHTTFQYIKKIILLLDETFTKLVSLDKQTNNLLTKSIEENNLEIALAYSNFLSDLTRSTEPITLIKYVKLDYNVISHLQKLKENYEYAKHLFNSIKFSFNSYLLYYSIITNNNIKIPKKKNLSVNLLETNIIELMNTVNSIIDKYWTEYIKANKLVLFLDDLIQNTHSTHIKAVQDNNIQAIAKIKDTINTLSLLSKTYDDNITYKLILVVDYLKIQLFLSTMVDHFIKNKSLIKL